MRFRSGRWALALAAFVAALLNARAWACADLDAARSTRWSLVTEHGVSWLVTPCGQACFSLGVNALDGGYPYRERNGKVYYSWTAFAPSQEAWVETTRRRLAAWGFNSAGAGPCRRSSCACRPSSTLNSAATPAFTGSIRSRPRPRRG